MGPSFRWDDTELEARGVAQPIWQTNPSNFQTSKPHAVTRDHAYRLSRHRGPGGNPPKRPLTVSPHRGGESSLPDAETRVIGVRVQLPGSRSPQA